MREEWGGKFDYLRQTQSLYHNDDYLAFLVQRVWKLTRKCNVIDVGCGYGFLGLKLLPLLPEGSTYTGVDHSLGLLNKGKRMFSGLSGQVHFVCADATARPIDESTFDVAICHALMMHLPSPKDAIGEMIRVTRNRGVVIACEANWNGVNALVHIHELAQAETTDLGFLQRLFEHNRRATRKDGNIGVKMPVLLHQAGLKNVQARLSDSTPCLFSPVDDPDKEALYQSLKMTRFCLFKRKSREIMASGICQGAP